MKILIATGNTHKLAELQNILKSHKLVSPADLHINFSFEETGSSFLENSMGKAFALYNLTKQPVLADDSGLNIPALNGEPGIYSARYGAQKDGTLLEASERNSYLLKKMEGITDRRAFFTCCMTLVLSPYRFFTVQETMEGFITHTPSGIHGFGYDPIFRVNGSEKTAAELSETEKNRISHRGKAGQRMAVLLEAIKDNDR